MPTKFSLEKTFRCWDWNDRLFEHERNPKKEVKRKVGNDGWKNKDMIRNNEKRRTWKQ